MFANLKNLLHILFIIFVALLILYIVLKYNILWSGLYKQNSFLDKKTNHEIQVLLLNTIKYQHSSILSPDKNKIFSQKYILNNIYKADSSIEKSAFVIIIDDFMDSVKQEDKNKYTAKIQLRWPNDWLYYFTIEKINNRYVISCFEIDP